ncbi:unnamed protein product [Trifolium pratense]|uniref:Uncharacterized protein n=1 Tax=Trifolium pratense TaxID=57577 RepID=A0ACB0LHX8_TRIPR|nr:unnamed protein product [Trifolium pratense]
MHNKRNNMAEILKIIYAMILFLSLFVDSAKYDHMAVDTIAVEDPGRMPPVHECENDDDCFGKAPPYDMVCLEHNCEKVRYIYEGVYDGIP